MSARINYFSTLDNFFKLQTFLFLVNVQSWDMCGWETRTATDFWVVKGKRIAVDGALKRKKRVLFRFMFKALTWNNACNYCVQRCDTYVPIPSICNQSIPIDINLSIDCYWKSIPIDNHTNLSHRWVIDYPYHLINWYRLVLVIKFIDWIPWDSMTHVWHHLCKKCSLTPISRNLQWNKHAKKILLAL